MFNKQNLEQLFANDFGSPYFPVLAECYMEEGDLVRAKQVCNIGLKHDSSNIVGKIMLSKIAMIEEKPTIAEKWLKQVITQEHNNILALRMLIRIELILKRKKSTILQYINMILFFLPNDLEANKWLNKISENNNPPKVGVVKNNKAKSIHSKSGKKKYKLTVPMATFTMVEILKKQKSYKQALSVLNLLESKKADSKKIKKERSLINSLLKKSTNKK